MTEHVILVAFTVEADTRDDAEADLRSALPSPSGSVESWWVAEDDRHDGSDCDSAVFVSPGFQEEASRFLADNGFTPRHNVAARPDSVFEV